MKPAMEKKIAKALLRQRDERGRRGLILQYLIVLVLIFLAHAYFSNLSTPFKVIPQTMTALAMGCVMLLIISVRQFRYIAEFINWDHVITAAEPGEGCNPEKPTGDERAR